jgi:hypothetical protein
MAATQEMLFEWDEWKERALARGIAEDFAELGKNLMRDAYMQRWPEAVLSDCGWDDDGFGMLALARAKPAETRRDWERLYAQYHRRPACPLEQPLSADAKALAPISPSTRPQGSSHTSLLMGHPK